MLALVTEIKLRQHRLPHAANSADVELQASEDGGDVHSGEGVAPEYFLAGLDGRAQVKKGLGGRDGIGAVFRVTATAVMSADFGMEE